MIINDGSNDELDLVKTLKNSIQINLKNNEGNQKAISIGLRFLRENKNIFDYIFVMDSDGEDDPKYLPALLEQAKKFNNEKNYICFKTKKE